MPRNRRRQNEANKDWETSDTEENHVNVSGGNSSSKRVGAGEVGERGDGNGNDRANNNTSGGRSRQSRDTSSQHEYQPSLGPWTQAVHEAVQSMGAAHQAIKDLQDKFTLHINDLRMMEETRKRLNQLEDECRDKDDELTRHEHTITTLTRIDQKTKDEIERKREEIEEQKKELDQEKAKLEKRVSVATAEERHKLTRELKELTTQHIENYEKRREELEDEFTRKRDENDRRVIAREAENEQLSTTVEMQKRTIETQLNRLEKTTEQCDVLERAKDSVKRDKQALEKELEMMKKEFALSPKSKDYFKQRFAEIYSGIEGISSKYFNGIDGKDLEKVHDELVIADPCFGSVPIDESDDSRNLRTAHAQRIISDALCQYIWKPLSSEFTQSHPELNGLLSKISDELDKSSHSGRSANVWTALTMRALQSLPAETSELKESPRPTRSRAESVVSKVLSALSPLVSSSQDEDLRMSLLELASSAIDIWNDAQTGELKIIVSPLLERARREEWRSQKFDPASPSGDYDETKLDMMSRTHPRIFTLFPRVVARGVADPVNYHTGPPGSLLRESDQAPRTIETYIHPGRGLPECSPLVVRGKEEQEERTDYLSQALEDAKKKLHSTRGISGHRRDSMGSSTSGPLSPTAMKFLEK